MGCENKHKKQKYGLFGVWLEKQKYERKRKQRELQWFEHMTWRLELKHNDRAMCSIMLKVKGDH